MTVRASGADPLPLGVDCDMAASGYGLEPTWFARPWQNNFTRWHKIRPVRSMESESNLLVQRRRPGRPRSDAARRAVLAAAIALFEEQGFARLTIEGIAERAGVGRPTIYRWWSSKAAVLMEAFLISVAPQIPFRGSGSARADLQQQIEAVIRLFAGPVGRMIASLIAEAQDDPELAAALRDRYLAERRALARTIIERGIASGEFRPDVDPDVVMDALYAPLYYRLLVRHLPLTVELAGELVAHVCQGLNAGCDSASL